MKNSKRNKRRKRLNPITIIVFVVILAIVGVGGFFFLYGNDSTPFDKISGVLPFATDKPKKLPEPDELLSQYFSLVNARKYEDMYSFLDMGIQTTLTKEDFVVKNQKIYDGIEVANLTITVTSVDKQDETHTTVIYDTRMNTLAGEVAFSNTAYFIQVEDKAYKLIWSSHMIFPSFNTDDKVKVNTIKAERGNIYDRNGDMLAGRGVASSVGLVPGKMQENHDDDIAKLSELLDIPVEKINKALSASYVKEDTFVPLKMIPKDSQDLEAVLLQVKGIKITDAAVRFYPLGEKASQLTGYIQNVTAEDLERLAGKEYNANSVIGKAGLEKIYEDTLRGIDGYEIVIVDSQGSKKETLATKSKKDGNSITLTIDGYIQAKLYDQFQEDKSCSVAMNPKTGEILALVSTPSFDANDFVLGISQTKWEALSTDPAQPLYNRFKAALCPGSGFKSIISGIGLSTGKFSPDEDYGHSGKSWQKDASWGGYKITTTKEYNEPAVLKNALIYSDNIYFAKTALAIGSDTLKEQLMKLGFVEKIPFEYPLYSSIFSSDDEFHSEIQLADSGYGQGQILVNPIHMAAMYSAFLNDGNMIQPYLIKSNQEPQYWIEHAFTEEAANTVYNDLIAVANHSFESLGLKKVVELAGKTGTAEIKTSKDDKDGTELGWFNAFTADKNSKNPLLIITMVEDVKDRGGSKYVVPKLKAVFDEAAKN